MKHLKKFKIFEKLSGETYKSAADKIRSSGQKRRANKIDIQKS